MAQKPVLLITGCRKYEDYLRAAIKRMDRDEWTVIGIRGSPAIDGSGGTAVFDETTRILTLPVSDLYENLPAKMHAAFKWIHEHHPGIPGIFKTDDDMLFDIPALVAAVKKNAALPYWGIAAGMCKGGAVNAGRIASRFDDKTLTPSHQSAIYCFGWGYWLAAATSLPLVVAAEKEYAGSPLEDVCTGYVLNRARIMPTKIILPYKEVPRSQQLLDVK